MSMSGSLLSIKDIHSNNTVPSYEKQSMKDVVSMYQEAEEVFYFCFQVPGYGQNMQLPHPKSLFLDFSLGSYGQISKLWPQRFKRLMDCAISRKYL